MWGLSFGLQNTWKLNWISDLCENVYLELINYCKERKNKYGNY
jgi:hypothetical protein